MEKCCYKGSKNFKQIDNSTELLKATTEPNRLRILCVLSKMDICVCELAKRLEASHNLMSHHLKTLFEVGILGKKRDGNKIYYFIKKKWKKRISYLFKFVQIN